ncbi:uncharacterized protein RCC_08783 [Ramularia collo-cygni]|uniref:Uncharacterized protein n=1 Tax=Ramularia collo-cygni TaxID=112498 RepID=A0A2D3V506_9PEZI|nr:uncharacterized protein RCC_08783 [Ramularia collo-cygni]CZT23073.1 uncharacterized protein RCC_08783 [Ramularia collo-cygni]
MSTTPSPAAIITAITTFYAEIAKQTHINEFDLKYPPPTGWPTIDVAGLLASGKTESVIHILRHIPYFELWWKNAKVLALWDATPIDYTRQRGPGFMDVTVHLPGHCVHLTEMNSMWGYNLILDVENGTITEYSTVSPNSNPLISETLPQPQKWLAHTPQPVLWYFETQTRLYARLIRMIVPKDCGEWVGKLLSRTESTRITMELLTDDWPLEEWKPDEFEMMKLVVEGAGWERVEGLWYAANVFNCHLRHGWPDAFDKDACRLELVAMEDFRDGNRMIE